MTIEERMKEISINLKDEMYDLLRTFRDMRIVTRRNEDERDKDQSE